MTLPDPILQNHSAPTVPDHKAAAPLVARTVGNPMTVMKTVLASATFQMAMSAVQEVVSHLECIIFPEFLQVFIFRLWPSLAYWRIPIFECSG